MDFGDRKELFRALVGSHNYNLNDETSDRDYKVFVAPTFDDLYFNNQFTKSYIGETQDFDCHDVRKISSLWWKANVNFLEVLYSKEIKINPYLDRETQKLIKLIFDSKEDIVKMNLPYLYKACIGMHITKNKQVDKGTTGTQDLVDKYGYDTKQAMHSIRILDFLRRFAHTQFKDFEYAINYKANDSFREALLDLKNGVYSRDEYEDIAQGMFENVEECYRELYLSEKPNEDTNNRLLELVKNIVKNTL